MLIIAEKYRVADLLATVLGYQYRYPFFYKDNEAGGTDIIAYAQGHLYQIEKPDPEHYNWSTPSHFNQLPKTYSFVPLHDENSEATVSVGKKGNKRRLPLHDLRKKLDILIREHSVIVNACDAERAGEQIFHSIFNGARVKNKEVLRLDLSRGITRSLIQSAYENMLPAKNFIGGYFAGIAQTVTDYHYAMLTQVLTYYGRNNLLNEILCGYKDATLSVVSTGRVQAALLFLIYEQSIATEREFEKNLFEPLLIAKVGGRHLRFAFDFDKHGIDKSMLAAASISQNFIKSIEQHNASLVVKSVETYPVYSEAPKPFSTAGVQAAMGDKTPAETLDILNELYLKGLITYPRTDSEDIEEDDFTSGNAAARLEAVLNNMTSQNSHQSLVDKAANIPTSQTPSCAKAIDGQAHTAIIPTAGQRDISQLSADEQQVYELIANRYIDAQMPPTEQTGVNIEMGLDKPVSLLGEPDTTFRVHSVVNVVHEDSDKSKNALINLDVGDSFPIKECRVDNVTLKTHQYFAVSSLPEIMKKNGIGTPATRHTFLDKLEKRRYVEIIKLKDDCMRVVITSKGIALLDSLNEKFKTPAVTAEWESELSLIEQESDPEHAQAMAVAFIQKKQRMIEAFIQKMNKSQNTQQSVYQQSLLTKQRKKELSQLGLHTDGDTLRDPRSVMLRQRFSKLGLLDLPPTPEQLEKAKLLAKHARMKLNDAIRSDAQKCQAFIEKAKKKVAPSKAQISAYRQLCAKHRIKQNPKHMETNALIEKEIRRLAVIRSN
ncbi:DNA topoisomerase [Photobacterium leiognathi]|uniref:DNA topoisomerase n=1 Tax=Photobacterium leiognathi TaxID=553611 RepID=UPI002981830E|nr:DNA topoisomerase [Photobacterium leiognathi]